MIKIPFLRNQATEGTGNYSYMLDQAEPYMGIA